MASAFVDKLKQLFADLTTPAVVAQHKRPQPRQIMAGEAVMPKRQIPPQVQGAQTGVENTFGELMRQREFPLSVGFGQWAAEGRDGGMGARRNNPMNLGAYDGQEQNMPSYPTLEDGLTAYLDLIPARYPDAWAAKDNPEEMLRLIQEGGYAGDPATYQQRAKNNFPSYSEFVKATPEWRKYAR